MNVAAIGRTQMLYDTMVALTKAGHVVTAIITAPAAPEYSRNERDFEDLAGELGVPVFATNRLDDPEIVAALARTEIGVSVNWGSVLKKKHLEIFKNGILNAHAGDLPKYRGNACPNWAILAGRKVHCFDCTPDGAGGIGLWRYYHSGEIPSGHKDQHR